MTEPSLAEQLDQPPRVLVAVAEQVGAELGLGFLRELGSLEEQPLQLEARHTAFVDSEVVIAELGNEGGQDALEAEASDEVRVVHVVPADRQEIHQPGRDIPEGPLRFRLSRTTCHSHRRQGDCPAASGPKAKLKESDQCTLRVLADGFPFTLRPLDLYETPLFHGPERLATKVHLFGVDRLRKDELLQPIYGHPTFTAKLALEQVAERNGRSDRH